MAQSSSGASNGLYRKPKFRPDDHPEARHNPVDYQMEGIAGSHPPLSLFFTATMRPGFGLAGANPLFEPPAPISTAPYSVGIPQMFHFPCQVKHCRDSLQFQFGLG